MPRLFKSVNLVNGKTTICFKNAAGELHRENGPAKIIISGDIIKYKYYINGTLYRRQKNGLDQPAYIAKHHGLAIMYHYYSNGSLYFNRANGNLPYYVRKSPDHSSYALRYNNFCIIHSLKCKRILRNIRNRSLYECPNLDTYRLDSGICIRKFGANRGEVPITPEKTHHRIGRVIMKNIEHLPLSQHF